MGKLVRISDSEGILPIKRVTLYGWYRTGKYLEIFVKIGRCLFLDIDRVAELIEKSRAENKVKT